MNARDRLDKMLRLRAELDELIAEEQQRAANDAPPSIPKYMTIQGYAKRLAVSVRTVQRWLKLGLPHQKIGAVTRILVAEADAWSEPKAIARGAELDAAGGGRR